MNSKKIKTKTVGLIDVMIQHADKGPSGFWTDDYEGCGNPKIFPEFEDGLKHGKYVHKDHYLCPWNIAVLYGRRTERTKKNICFQRIYVSDMYPDGCETCYLSEHCNRTYCLRNQEELQALREQMSNTFKSKNT